METKKKRNYSLGTYLGVGFLWGVTFGVIFDQLALWLSIGTALGICMDQWAIRKDKEK